MATKINIHRVYFKWHHFYICNEILISQRINVKFLGH